MERVNLTSSGSPRPRVKTISMEKKQVTDIIFKNIFLVFSTFSVLAFLAIILFVFAQGIVPFVTSTAEHPRLIPFGIREFTVNQQNQNVDNLPQKAKYIDLTQPSYTIGFNKAGEDYVLELKLDPGQELPADRLRILSSEKASVEYAEEYVYEVVYKGRMAGQEYGFYVTLPQEPTRLFADFLKSAEWRPTYNKQYGIMTMVLATLLSTLGAILIGVPPGLLTAVFLAEFIPPGPGRLVRGGIDLLAGIPSVVYGFFGLMVIVPQIKRISGAASGNGLLSAIIILAVMMLPTIISISETSLRAVPKAYREGSLALGATKMQTARKVVFPTAKSGILASVILGTSRALGETMAVIMVAGNSPQIPHKLTDGIRTLTATIALEMGYAQGRHNRILFSVGIVLFTMILTLNAVILTLKKRMTEES